jgi:hypothetical protein
MRSSHISIGPGRRTTFGTSGSLRPFALSGCWRLHVGSVAALTPFPTAFGEAERLISPCVRGEPHMLRQCFRPDYGGVGERGDTSLTYMPAITGELADPI